MYNERRKQQFLDETFSNTNVRLSCLKMLILCEPYEQEAGRDISTFEKDSLQIVVNQLSGRRERSHLQLMRHLRMYVKWCSDNGFPVSDAIYNITPSHSDNIKEQMVANPLALQHYLDCVFDPENELTVDNVYRLWLWFAYAGLTEEETFKVTANNIALDSMTIELQGESYEIYRWALPALKNCLTLTQFNVQNQERHLYRAESDLVLRTAIIPNGQAFRTHMSRKTGAAQKDGKTDMRLTYRSIWYSGIFYRQYERESAGLDVSFLDIAQRTMLGQYKIGSNITKEKFAVVRKQKSYNFSQDYKSWKRVFHQ